MLDIRRIDRVPNAMVRDLYVRKKRVDEKINEIVLRWLNMENKRV